MRVVRTRRKSSVLFKPTIGRCFFFHIETNDLEDLRCWYLSRRCFTHVCRCTTSCGRLGTRLVQRLWQFYLVLRWTGVQRDGFLLHVWLTGAWMCRPCDGCLSHLLKLLSAFFLWCSNIALPRELRTVEESRVTPTVFCLASLKNEVVTTVRYLIRGVRAKTENGL